MSLSLITCSYCSNKFLKENKHINENRKLGHRFYCSIKCQNSSKNKKVELICENPDCENKFIRSFSHRSFRNFCSSTCAMKIIGPENGRKHKKYNYCKYCGQNISSKNIYCSSKVLQFQLSRSDWVRSFSGSR